MCTVCGCGPGETRVEGSHSHSHDHAPVAPLPTMEAGAKPLHFGKGPAGTSVPGMAQSRLIQIERDILSKNDSVAAENRRAFAARGVLALNLVSSPGAGKTTLLVETLKRLKGQVPMAVVEGDQETTNDADRIRATGVPAIQVNTGKGCHLDAEMVATAIDRLGLPAGGILFIENVGNLVCPAGFDLGEAHKVVIASVTEGEDKPLKYPGMFAAASVMVVSKVDLAPYCDADVDLLVANARKVNPALGVVRVSTRGAGTGLDQWLSWIEAARTLRAVAE
jgi:hydrogenase nickel incorporation protein HypB